MELRKEELSFLVEYVAKLATPNYNFYNTDEREELLAYYIELVGTLTVTFPEGFTAEALMGNPQWLMEPAWVYSYLKSSARLKMTPMEFRRLVPPEDVAELAAAMLPIAVELLRVVPQLPLIMAIETFDAEQLDDELEALLRNGS